MELNSYMSYIQKIILLAVCSWLWADFHPENRAMLNYTQVFIRWEQIPNTQSYVLSIQNIRSGATTEFISPHNSNLVTNFMDWNSTYNWSICGLDTDGENIFCSEIYSFDVNPLPDYFPDDINVSNYDESLYQDGVTVMDYESLNFSGGLDKDGNPI